MGDRGALKKQLVLDAETDNTDEILSISAAAKMVGRQPKSIRRWIYAGRLPAKKTPGKYGRFIIRKSDLMAAVEYEPPADMDKTEK